MNSTPPLDLIILGGFSPEEEEGLQLALNMIEEDLENLDEEDQIAVHLHAAQALRRCLDLPQLTSCP